MPAGRAKRSNAIDYETLKTTLEKKFGVQVVLGTHPY
jgi:hypothetical protein